MQVKSPRTSRRAGWPLQREELSPTRMTLAEFYPTIKLTHIGLVYLSGSLFAIRGLAVILGSATAMRAPVRYVSYAIDTALLTAALLLLTTLRLNPFVTPWLAAKLILLVCYIVLGSLALKRARTQPRRVLAFGAALLCFGSMYSIARAHHPFGCLGRMNAGGPPAAACPVLTSHTNLNRVVNTSTLNTPAR